MSTITPVKILSFNNVAASNVSNTIMNAPINDVETLNTINAAATFLGNPYVSAQSGVNNLLSQRNEINGARNNVFSSMNSFNSNIVYFKNNLEFANIPAVNPFGSITSFAGSEIPDAVADDFVNTIFNVANLALGNASSANSGVTQLGNAGSAQISSARFELPPGVMPDMSSFDGNSISTPSARFQLPPGVMPDISSFDGNSIPIRNIGDVGVISARKTVAAFDFRRRNPSILFTAAYEPDGIFRGVIVGWKKMLDASGYVIKKRSTFRNKETNFSMSNFDMDQHYASIKSYVDTCVLDFYNIDKKSVIAYLDSSIDNDEVITYRVQAYQTQNSKSLGIFKSNYSKQTIPKENRAAIKAQLERELAKTSNSNTEVISAYSVLSQIFFGDPQFDWILAGVNTRESLDRGDLISQTQLLSFMIANIDDLFEIMDAGKFVAPEDVNVIVDKIKRSITKNGAMQTLKEILVDTGLMFFFEGGSGGVVRDYSVDSLTGVINAKTNNLFLSVASALDPETMTINLGVFSSNLIRVLSNTAGESQSTSKIQSRPQEASLPSNVQFADFSETGSNVLGRNVLDLTTFEGIGMFVRNIRAAYESFKPHFQTVNLPVTPMIPGQFFPTPTTPMIPGQFFPTPSNSEPIQLKSSTPDSTGQLPTFPSNPVQLPTFPSNPVQVPKSPVRLPGAPTVTTPVSPFNPVQLPGAPSNPVQVPKSPVRLPGAPTVTTPVSPFNPVQLPGAPTVPTPQPPSTTFSPGKQFPKSTSGMD
jgi:hypothetical protein